MHEAQNAVREAFRNLSSFIGGLRRAEAIDAASAQTMLVQGFWEIEAEAAYEEENLDLAAFARDYCETKQLVAVAE